MSFFVYDVVSLQRLSNCNLCMSSNSIMVIVFYFDGLQIGYQRLELNSLPPHHPWPILPPALQKKHQHLKGNNNHRWWWSHTYMYFPYFQYQVKITCGWIVHRFFLRYLQDDPKRGTKHTINWWVWVTYSLNNWWVVVQVLQGLNNNFDGSARFSRLNNWWVVVWVLQGWTTIDGSGHF